jgi:hypothetical protein
MIVYRQKIGFSNFELTHDLLCYGIRTSYIWQILGLVKIKLYILSFREFSFRTGLLVIILSLVNKRELTSQRCTRSH